MVWVKDQDHWQQRLVKTGRRQAEQIEILAGLSGNETIGF
jgi:hypothetical protein